MNFPGIFAILFYFLIDVEARDQSHSSPLQHNDAASCPPHAHLTQPHVRSGSAPPQTAGTVINIPWNARGSATCPDHFQSYTSTTFQLYPVPPRTC
jgi:hypothetical protein